MAGNLFMWQSFLHFILDEETRTLLLTALHHVMQNGHGRTNRGTVRIELTYKRFVGCDSVMNGEDLKPDDKAVTIQRTMNGRGAVARFLLLNKILAPQTEVVTLVGNLCRNGHLVTYYLYTMYPGEDCGDLNGDMTAKHDWYWLSWYNEGDRLPGTD